MSDEEKKAIADLIDSSNLSLLGDGTCINSNKTIATILNLIEKQQKEIEELKEVKWYYEISRVPKDKIKAKIEPKLKELDEQINEEWKKYGNSKELQDMEDMYNFLQSLLEKE